MQRAIGLDNFASRALAATDATSGSRERASKVVGYLHEKLFHETWRRQRETNRETPKNGVQTSGSYFEGPNTKDCATTAKNGLNRPKK
jgi:hypothetical protein